MVTIVSRKKIIWIGKKAEILSRLQELAGEYRLVADVIRLSLQ